jgi:hypothetical protein
VRAYRLVSAPVRVNMVVALADLASRWPNVLEPWTAYMYEPLSGEHLEACHRGSPLACCRHCCCSSCATAPLLLCKYCARSTVSPHVSLLPCLSHMLQYVVFVSLCASQTLSRQ